MALLGVTSAVSIKKRSTFAEGVPNSEEHGQSIKMKEKTLQEFNVVQQKAAFAEGMPNSEEHGQSIKMKEKTLQEFNVVQLEDGPTGPPPRGEKMWQNWAGDMQDFLDGQTNFANTRIPYQSYV